MISYTKEICNKILNLVVYPGATSNRSLEWKKADVFKINGDDDELSKSGSHLDKNIIHRESVHQNFINYKKRVTNVY